MPFQVVVVFDWLDVRLANVMCALRGIEPYSARIHETRHRIMISQLFEKTSSIVCSNNLLKKKSHDKFCLLIAHNHDV